MHVVVNDRLGRRYEIRCLRSDSIKELKEQVARRSGTPAERILLKRQGMRAFKNELTLEEYEIGDGAALDLEVDTME